MRNLKQENVPRWGTRHVQESIKNTFTKSNHSTTNLRRKHAPYSKDLTTKPLDKTVIVMTGSDAWDIAKKKNSISLQPKLLLPFRVPPDSFKWPVRGRECMVVSYGCHEFQQTILLLTQCLLSSAATSVVWGLHNKSILRVNPAIVDEAAA
jgi:hypothetical protein